MRRSALSAVLLALAVGAAGTGAAVGTCLAGTGTTHAAFSDSVEVPFGPVSVEAAEPLAAAPVHRRSAEPGASGPSTPAAPTAPAAPMPEPDTAPAPPPTSPAPAPSVAVPAPVPATSDAPLPVGVTAQTTSPAPEANGPTS